MVNEYNAVIVAAIIAGISGIISIIITIVTNRYFRKMDYETEQYKWVTKALSDFYLPFTRYLNKLKNCLQNYLAMDKSSTFDSLIDELAEIKESLGGGIRATYDVKRCVNAIVQFISKEKFIYIDHNLFHNYNLIEKFIFTLDMAIEEKIVSQHHEFNIDIIDRFIKRIDSVSYNLSVLIQKSKIQ